MIHEPMYAHDGGPAAIARGEANNDGIMAHAFASGFFSCSWGSSHQFAFRLSGSLALRKALSGLGRAAKDLGDHTPLLPGTFSEL